MQDLELEQVQILVLPATPHARVLFIAALHLLKERFELYPACILLPWHKMPVQLLFSHVT